MENKKDIGKLIKDQLEHLKKSPDDALWTKINTSLDKRARIRKRLFSLLVISFVLILSFTIYYQTTDIFNISNESEISSDTEQSDVNSDIKKTNNINYSNSTASPDKSVDYAIPQNDINITDSEKQINQEESNFDFKQHATAVSTNENKQEENLRNQIRENDNKTVAEKHTPAQTQDGSKQDNKVATPENINNNATAFNLEETDRFDIKDKIEDTIEEIKTEVELPITLKDSINDPMENELLENTQEKNPYKWSVSVNGGYITYTPFNNNSLIDSNLNDNSREGNFTFSYGATLNFHFGENMRFSVGANRNIMSYSTANVPTSNETQRNRILNYTSLDTSPDINLNQFTDFIKNDPEINLIHELEYLEVPLLFTYRFKNNRFGFLVNGGMSMNILLNNEVFAQHSNNDVMKLGEINTLMNGNISLNLGAGVYYNISERLSLEVNPSFSYSMIKYSNRSGTDQPNLFGVYSILTYKLW